MTDDIDIGALRQFQGMTGDAGGDLASEILDVFASHMPVKLKDMRAAVARGDTVEAKRHAHSMAGSSVTVGAVGIAALAREAEALAALGRLEGMLTLADVIEQLLPSAVARLRAAAARG